MMAEFDPAINDDKIHDHCLGPFIQNESIDLLAAPTKLTIVVKVKEAKYFSGPLNCTPDASHREHMPLIMRHSICLEESSLGFFGCK